jgi:hypothetical protein
MSNQDWEHAALNRDFMVYYGREQDIAKYLESLTTTPAETTAK